MNTVLLVEDDLDNSMLIEDVFAFSELDVELVITETGEEALRLAGEQQPVLILMDLQLPGIFAGEAERLITEEHVSVVFGCWTSASRKSVKSVFGKDLYVTQGAGR